jgi:hypothetical protein
VSFYLQAIEKDEDMVARAQFKTVQKGRFSVPERFFTNQILPGPFQVVPEAVPDPYLLWQFRR